MASATLLKNGKVVAAVDEERFTRIKHDSSFPKNAINYCLKSQNITIESIDHIGFYEKPLLKFERLIKQHIEYFPKSWKMFVQSLPLWLIEKLRIQNKIRKLGYKKDIIFIKHHLSHAASSFLVSPFKDAAICTFDGVGEYTTTSYGIGYNNNIKLLNELEFPHSIGLFYSTITAYLGFRVNNSEYKVMGLAAYGNKNKNTNPYYKKLKQVIIQNTNSSFSLDLSYFKFMYTDKMPSNKLCKLLGGNIRKKNEQLNTRHKDIAAALQIITEEYIFNILNHVQKETKQENLVMAGGVALNSVLNGKILKTVPRENLASALTPQVFQFELILEMHQKAQQEKLYFTDDAAILEHYGLAVSVLETSAQNIKITDAFDLKIAEILLK